MEPPDIDAATLPSWASPGRERGVPGGISERPGAGVPRVTVCKLGGGRGGRYSRVVEDCPDECGGEVDADGVADLLGDLALSADELVVRLVVVEAHRARKLPVLQHAETDVEQVWAAVNQDNSPGIDAAGFDRAEHWLDEE